MNELHVDDYYRHTAESRDEMLRIGQHVSRLQATNTLAPFSLAHSRNAPVFAPPCTAVSHDDERSPSTVPATADDAVQRIELLHEEVRMRRVRGRFLLKPLGFLLHALFYLENFCRLIVILNNKQLLLFLCSKKPGNLSECLQAEISIQCTSNNIKAVKIHYCKK